MQIELEFGDEQNKPITLKDLKQGVLYFVEGEEDRSSNVYFLHNSKLHYMDPLCSSDSFIHVSLIDAGECKFIKVPHGTVLKLQND